MLYLQVTKYESNNKLEWDDFVKCSKNGHFFFYRDYMEYHSDRFQDFSLIIYNNKGNIMALLPASIDGDTVISHGGLTFGGFVCDSKMTAAKMLVCCNIRRKIILVGCINKQCILISEQSNIGNRYIICKYSQRICLLVCSVCIRICILYTYIAH